MTDKLDIVLFPKGFDRGIPADDIELTDQDAQTVTYRVTFTKPGGPPVAAAQHPMAGPEGPTGGAVEQVVPFDSGDDGATPEDVDYAELPDLPGVAA